MCNKYRLYEYKADGRAQPLSKVVVSKKEDVIPVTNRHEKNKNKNVWQKPSFSFLSSSAQVHPQKILATALTGLLSKRSKPAELSAFSLVSFLADAQMARQNAILFTKSARL